MKTPHNNLIIRHLYFSSVFILFNCTTSIELASNTSNISEPSKFDIFLHSFAASTVLAPFYNNYINSIDLHGNEKVLDFGSGWGTTSELLAKRLINSGSVTCLDISEEWINTCKKKLKDYSNVNYLLGDITKLNIPDTTYNIILIHFVLHDIDSCYRQDIISKQVKILKNGGRIFIREPILASRYISTDYIKNLMIKNGLTVVTLRKTKSLLIGEMVEGIFIKTN